MIEMISHLAYQTIYLASVQGKAQRSARNSFVRFMKKIFKSKNEEEDSEDLKDVKEEFTTIKLKK